MALRKDDIKTRLLATFGVEAQEHLQVITANLLALDQGLPSDQVREVVEATFREVHTLKGAARSVSEMTVEKLCQAWESLLSKITRGQLALSRIMPLINSTSNSARLCSLVGTSRRPRPALMRSHAARAMMTHIIMTALFREMSSPNGEKSP